MTDYNGNLIAYCILSSGKLVTHIIRFCCINYKWNKQFCHHGGQWIHHMLYVNILVICLLFKYHKNPFPSLRSSHSLRVLTKIISTLPVYVFKAELLSFFSFFSPVLIMTAFVPVSFSASNCNFIWERGRNNKKSRKGLHDISVQYKKYIETIFLFFSLKN